MSQLDMFGGPLPTTEMKRAERAAERRAARPSIDQRFAEFFRDHPKVYAELLRLAKDRLARGAKRIGMKALWEELRQVLHKVDLAYDDDFETDKGPNGTYRLNNDFTALYARKLIQNHPELAAVIEVRKRKGEK